MRAVLADAADAGRPGRRADRRHLDARAVPRRRPLGRARRLGRRVGGAVLGVRRAPGRRPRRAGRQPRVLRDRTPGARVPGAVGSRPCTTRGPSGCWPPTSPSASASRSRPCREPTTERLAGLLDPGLEPTNPLDVWGTGNDTEDLLSELPGRPRRRPGGRRRRARGRPGAGVRRRRVLPEGARAAGRPHRQAGRRAVEPRVRHRRAAGRRPARPRHPGARGDPLRACGRWATCSTTRHRRARPDAGGRGAAGALVGAAARRRGRPVRAAGRLRHPGGDHRDGGRPRTAAVAAAERCRLPGRAQDRRPGHPPQARRRRRPAPARRTAPPSRRRTPTWPARLGPSVSVQPEVPGGRGRARAVARPAARTARAGRGRRLARRAAGRARRWRCRPVDADTARGLVARLRLSELLAGHRGRPALDDRRRWSRRWWPFAQLAHELGDLLEAVDVNPLVVGPAGVVAVDALVVPAVAVRSCSLASEVMSFVADYGSGTSGLGERQGDRVGRRAGCGRARRTGPGRGR